MKKKTDDNALVHLYALGETAGAAQSVINDANDAVERKKM